MYLTQILIGDNSTKTMNDIYLNKILKLHLVYINGFERHFASNVEEGILQQTIKQSCGLSKRHDMEKQISQNRNHTRI